ncbi:hypothetical protein BKK81_21190 [Cupriavidus sp. USMAHM13]|uniref:DUF985 domain-containing protein n=1 Tax=Cupriavidus malaysiensis TaxID=367825 RepID=A0ABN4TN49_9BURK|nr:cupin domain-containing protein [Cupriavidus malaysiensis]AOZ01875.1 hypothetical protein BKK81_21190 [Cupriavidus sp. USMAHM13]AOZ08388.1 hypothetical protein BKK80_20690 [Cupriavidus malaysiensis]
MTPKPPVPVIPELIARFALQPHPEGGYYRETHRDPRRVRREGAVEEGLRHASTAIYYLLCGTAHSAWHRIRSDEVWHFYAGGPLDVHVLDPDGGVHTLHLGNALAHPGTVFQAVVPAGSWFAAERADAGADPDGFALAGCTVAPGFEFAEFELADMPALLAAYPDHAALLARLAPRAPADR